MADNPAVTAVMITGKTPERYPIAFAAVESFLNQTYEGPKQLLIINDNPIPLYQDKSKIPPNVVEVAVPPATSLGALRNIAFEHVTTGLVVQWDDDDFSRPNRLKYQIAATPPGTVSVLKWQIQYDLVTGKHCAGCGRVSGVGGFPGTMVFPADLKLRFPDKAKGEDSDFLKELRNTMHIVRLDNMPQYYIHLCHANNTWHREHVMRWRPGSRRLTAKELQDLRFTANKYYAWAVQPQ